MTANPPKRVMITGGTGMIGRLIAQAFHAKGVEVVTLSRSFQNIAPYKATYRWNPATGEFDAQALDGVDTIIHLAGAGIADKRWTEQRKQEIIESRVASTHLLASKLREIPNTVQTIVAASAIGYYGNSGKESMSETSHPGSDFLAITCVQWEQALGQLEADNRRLVILRIGIVLDAHDGALPVMARPVRLFAGAPYGSGEQYVSWVDSSDLVGMFLFATTNSNLSGTYNAVAPSPVTNRELMQRIGKLLHRPVWPVAVPAFVFRLLLGEQAAMILGGQHVSCGKLIRAGFAHRYTEVSDSLKHQLKR